MSYIRTRDNVYLKIRDTEYENKKEGKEDGR